MLRKEEIEQYLEELNQELRFLDVKGEICLYGGAVMCLVYNARPSTKDVDAVFKPGQIIRDAAKKIAQHYGIDEDWLNDGVKGYVVTHPKKVLFNWSHLKVYVADAEYLLAMKSLAARVDGMDKEDIIFLIRELGIESPEDVFDVLEKYYPHHRIRPTTQFFIEEIFEV
ncbi:MAG: DUF6036 family nucleotidyltransferase [Candidatus Vecturithrix sp.]|jgi:hypothetical protein|nr:DUF6036 family nucleotidyltransferase [Candidatus Vecturithrix sp.]